MYLDLLPGVPVYELVVEVLVQWNGIYLEELVYAFDDPCEDAWRGNEPHDQGPILEKFPVEIKSQILPVTLVDGYVMVGIS